MMMQALILLIIEFRVGLLNHVSKITLVRILDLCLYTWPAGQIQYPFTWSIEVSY